MSKFWQKKYTSKYTGAEIDAAVGNVPVVTSADVGKALVVDAEGKIVAGEAGTTVVANPTLAGTEAALEGLQVGETKYKVGGGSSEEWIPKFTLHIKNSGFTFTESLADINAFNPQLEDNVLVVYPDESTVKMQIGTLSRTSTNLISIHLISAFNVNTLRNAVKIENEKIVYYIYDSRLNEAFAPIGFLYNGSTITVYAYDPAIYFQLTGNIDD